MKFGAWIHTGGGIDLASQIGQASQEGMSTIRSYGYAYAAQAAPALKAAGMSLLAGMHIDSAALVADWKSQVWLDELERYHQLGVRLEAVCVGNELREGGDDPLTKRFTARLSFGLANVLRTYRSWLDDHGYDTPLTYAMEGIVFDAEGSFYEWLWPLVDACDIVGLNLYPMGHWEWFTYRAFEESRRFLHDSRVRNDRLAEFELHLRRACGQLAALGKSMILTETGFPSAIGYAIEGERTVVPESDGAAYGSAMGEFIRRIRQADTDYSGIVRALYFYEWRDNLFHSKIWNVEQSPIHVAFGLCDRYGAPKFDLAALIREG